MSEGNGGSGVNALAVVAILVIVLLVAFFVFKSGMLGGGEGKSLDVNIKTPSLKEPAN